MDGVITPLGVDVDEELEVWLFDCDGVDVGDGDPELEGEGVPLPLAVDDTDAVSRVERVLLRLRVLRWVRVRLRVKLAV